MKAEYFEIDAELTRTIETAGPDQSYPWMKPGIVYEFDGSSGEYGPTEFAPAQARAKAAALLRAADEAEGVTFFQSAIDGSHNYDAAEYAEDACQVAGPVVDFVQMLEGTK
ncbi:hypothetical protein [Streptomyces lydicus]|uniref:hypothetical protein n=1 Tax=Streptomyces lydicus TaxID=47763 RepID=UPI00378989CA